MRNVGLEKKGLAERHISALGSRDDDGKPMDGRIGKAASGCRGPRKEATHQIRENRRQQWVFQQDTSSGLNRSHFPTIFSSGQASVSPRSTASHPTIYDRGGEHVASSRLFPPAFLACSQSSRGLLCISLYFNGLLASALAALWPVSCNSFSCLPDFPILQHRVHSFCTIIFTALIGTIGQTPGLPFLFAICH